MTENGRFATAGLVFTAYRDLDIVRIANHAASGLGALGHRVAHTRILSDTEALVVAADHEIRLAVEEDVALTALPDPAATFLSVRIASIAAHTAPGFARDSVIARTLQSLLAELRPDHVKWIDTDVLLTSRDFAEATCTAPPRPARPDAASGTAAAPQQAARGKPLPDIEETNEILQRRLSDQDPSIFDAQSDRARDAFSDHRHDPFPGADTAWADEAVDEDIEHAAPRRLSAWMMSLAVAVLALPIGITLFLLNLMKGENLRLASQTAALTGTFVSLEAYGGTAQAMAMLQTILD